MMIGMMICLFATMLGPFLLSFITRITIGVSLDTILLTLGIVNEGVGQAIISTALLLVLGTILVLVGTRRLGRPDP
jgi:hypothetical protein